MSISKENSFAVVVPGIKGWMEEKGVLRFTLYNTDVCFANAIRRVMLSDIKVCYISDIDISVNTGRLHNELLKHRLGCIPVHIKDSTQMEKFCSDYVLEIECENESDEMRYVTSEDFHIKKKSSGEYIESKSIFPRNEITNEFIDLSRLRSKISDTIAGESLKVSAGFSIGSASEDSMWNATSDASYSNSLDREGCEKKWAELESNLKGRGVSEEEVKFEKRNFFVHDAFRIFVPNSFDFIVKGIVYSNKRIVELACVELMNKFRGLISSQAKMTISSSQSTMNFSYDIVICNEDSTVGTILGYLLYTHYYIDKTLSYCGFKKIHPHDSSLLIRIAFRQECHVDNIRVLLDKTCQYAIDTIELILELL